MIKIYTAKTIKEERVKNKLLLKYTFIDVQNEKEDWFLSDQKIGCIFNLVGKLILSKSDDRLKFYKSFKQDIANLTKEEEATLLNFGEEPYQKTKKVESVKKKIRLSFHQLQELKQKKIRGKKLNQKEIAKFTGYTDRMVRYWEKFADQPRLKKGVKSKMTKKLKILLHFYLRDHPKSFQRETVKYFRKKYGVELHRSTISRATKEIGFSRKKIPYRYSKQKELLPQFWEFIKKMEPLLESPYLLALDESGFPLNMAPTWGYAPIGERVEADKPGWGENFSLLLLIQNVKGKGIIHWKLVGGTVDALVFNNFLREVVLPTNDKYYLLMDNASFHKRVGKYGEYKEKDPSFLNFPIEYRETGLPPAPEYLTSRNVQVEFITPYFPQLNPVEELFNVIKGYVRKCEPRTYEELKADIGKTIDMLQGKDMTEYFSDCLDYDFILKSIEKSGNKICTR